MITASFNSSYGDIGEAAGYAIPADFLLLFFELVGDIAWLRPPPITNESYVCYFEALGEPEVRICCALIYIYLKVPIYFNNIYS